MKNVVKEKFSNRFNILTDKFKQNEFIFFIIYRNLPGIPFFITNILPTIFNLKIRNFFFGSVVGMTPQLFVGVSLGAGINKVLEENKEPQPFLLHLTPEIYFPILGIFFILIAALEKSYFKIIFGAPIQN